MARFARRCARALELRGAVPAGGHNSGPERLLLQWVQDQPAVEAALIPGVADKALPVLNVGRGPGGEPFGAAGAMKRRRKGSRGAFAGRNHQPAGAQAGIDLHRG